MPLIKTRKSICDYVGEDLNDFLTLIQTRGLPAWRSKPSGIWKARRASLNTWLREQERHFLQAEKK